jgi:RpiR family carbohydrate utilization transcriptional regulator
MAVAADVSEPTVNRFCRSLGCKGFPDFKLRLAQTIANPASFQVRGLNDTDTAPLLADKLFETAMSRLGRARARLPEQDLAGVIGEIRDCQRLLIYGLGPTSGLARGAQELFIGAPVTVLVHTDAVIQELTANTASDGDLFLFLCTNGETAPMVQSATLADERGARLIAIAPTGSPLARACHRTIDLVLDSASATLARFTNRLVCQMVLEVLAEALEQGVRIGKRQKRGLAGPTEQAAR